MRNEDGEWVMSGVADGDPSCVHTYDEMVDFVNEAGFIPLFGNEIVGFSLEDRVNPMYWFSGYERDPWEWRKNAARGREMAYGKFFGGKAGFISLEWLPVFISYRRKGYDFDSLWYNGLAQFRQKKIMEVLTDNPEMHSHLLRKAAGFGKGGEKNFEGTMASLQNMLYVVISDFRQRRNKYGEPYGWDLTVYSRPEEMWGYGMADAGYALDPMDSYLKIRERFEELYPRFTEKQFTSMIGPEPI